MTELRKKNNAIVEQLTEQLEAMKRVKTAMENSKTHMEANTAEVTSQLNAALATKYVVLFFRIAISL